MAALWDAVGTLGAAPTATLLSKVLPGGRVAPRSGDVAPAFRSHFSVSRVAPRSGDVARAAVENEGE